ncbi:hypothetical protein K493DRAFT_210243 [Basidiobolus meristosporus CBS 931.73]|uniref:HECT-type E3 ubiquitin transferase n=1 Tax=Basidiobolus meristosporus CBS 931.73 TaxID=1314790 RepID=A0A1Y1YTW0_9FUNG|nr:hypothetical protein K493DRAFT_210243 [Basidiobolus meristosporus CBS 931.73]|eukprot:ORY01005.1 hypothetical protein K493DRAFT_210243 [Basidiobolus meristosporus CBS 931.73]
MEFEADDYDDLNEHDDDDEEEEEEDDDDDEEDDDDYEDEELAGAGEFASTFSGLTGLRGLGGIISGVSARLKSILGHLRCYQEPSIQLIALQELAEILSVATEDTLTGYFSCDPFVKELVNLMKGSEFSFGEESPEIMLLACRCLSNLMEALPSAVGSVVYNGAIPVLCSKLMEIQYIDLAEQALSTLEKISVEYPTSIVREGGLLAVLMYLDFFSTNVQRTAVTTAANCSRNVPNDCFDMIKEVVPILERLLSYSDQKVIDQACLALVRLVESFKYNTEHLESIVSKDLAQNILNLLSSTTTSVVSPHLYTQLLTLLRHTAKGSSKLAFELLHNNIVEILYQILTGSVLSKSEPNHLGDDSAALTKLVNRPGDQVWEALGVAIELLPPLPKDGDAAQESQTSSSSTKTNSESEADSRMELFKKNPAVMAKFAEVLLPTFIEVFSSTVVTQVRLRVVAALLKTVFYTDIEVLTRVLKGVSFAGFIAAVLSRQDHPMLVVGAIQLAELLMVKLPDLYHLLFYREGVMNEIIKLSDNVVTSETQNEAEQQHDLIEGSKVTKDQVDTKLNESAEHDGAESSNQVEVDLSIADSSRTPRTPSRSSRAQKDSEVTPSAGLRLIEKFAMSLGSSNLGALTRLENGVYDIRKWISQKSMEFRKKYIDVDQQQSDGSSTIQSAHKVMRDLEELASKLKGDSNDPLALDTLVSLTGFLKTPEESATSFEFLQSGLMEHLLEYLTNPNYSPTDLSKRQLAFLHVFVGGPHPSFNEAEQAKIISSEPKIAAFPVLVKKLQQSLTQLEPFEVVTSYQSPLDEVRNPTSMLAKQIKLKLIPEDGLEVPSSYSNLVVSIHAIATFKALDDYLKPRVAFASSSSRLGDRLSSSRLANAFAAFAAAAGLDADDSRENERLDTLNQGKLDDSEGEEEEEEDDEHTENLKGGEDEMELGEEKDSSDMEVDEESHELKDDPTPTSKGKTTEGVADEHEEGEQASKQAKLSYASAAQKATDWHLEFSIGDVVIDTEWTIYKAIHQHLNQTTQKSRNIWSTIYPVKYRKVSDSSKKITQPQSSKSEYSPAEKSAGDNSLKDSYCQILQLLRELHSLNTRYLELYSQTDLCLESLAVLSPSKFINGKLTAKMNRQLDEPMVVVSSCLPSWCEYLANEYPFLFPFGTRYLYLQSTAFGYSRSIARYQNQQSRSAQQDTRRDESQPLLGRIQRQKVRISRSRMLESAVKVMDLYGSQQSILEVEYFEEAGTGLGPTLEFYATVSKEFCKKSLKLWRDDDDSDPSRKYVTSQLGLFPRPVSESYLESENGMKILNLFKAMGKFVAKALIDSRIIDLPFNPIFIKTLLNPAEDIKNLRSVMHIDSVLGNSLKIIKHFVREKQRIMRNSALNEAERQEALNSLRHNGVSLDDLCLDFTLPGYPEIEFVENGANVAVTIENVEEYLDGVLEHTVGSGVTTKVAAFRDGFNTVFPLKHLNAFSPEELVMLFGQAEEDWSAEMLLDAIKADHGYTLESRPIQFLIDIMSSFTSEQRREFLQFVTGSPKLPIGGFKNLLPAFTVVCKPNELPLTPDDYLPSVMTCVNYLKMPNYSTEEIMRKKLEKAMKEGQGSFHLS